MTVHRGDPGAVLRDPDLDATLRREGFVVVPFLDALEIEEIRRAYESIRPDDEIGMAIDYARYDRGLVRQVTGLLEGVWDRHFPGLFIDRQAILSTFLTKYPGPDSSMRVHREPTFVEVADDDPTNIWVSLVDVTAAAGNGVLEVVPGTQHLTPWLSGYDTPEIFSPYEAFLRRHASAVDVTAGSAVIFHARMLHFSGPNVSDEPRLAFGAVVARREARLVHVMATGRRGRRLYSVDRDFVTDCHPLEVGAYLHARDFESRVTEDPAELDPRELALVMGVEEVPRAVPVVPEDVLGEDAADDLLVLEPTPVPGARVPDHDVDPSQWEATPGPFVGGSFQASTEGYASLGHLDEVIERGWPADLATMTPGPAADATLAVVAPHARVTVRSMSERSVTLDFAVYECPVASSGLRSPDAVAAFTIGHHVQIDSIGPITMWNNGPGPVWVVISPVRHRRRPWNRRRPARR